MAFRFSLCRPLRLCSRQDMAGSFSSEKYFFGLFLSHGIHSIVFSVTALIKSMETVEYFLDDASRLVPQFLV